MVRRLQDIENPLARRLAEAGWSQVKPVTMCQANGTPVSLSTIQNATRGVLTPRTARILGAVLAVDPATLLPPRPPAPDER